MAALNVVKRKEGWCEMVMSRVGRMRPMQRSSSMPTQQPPMQGRPSNQQLQKFAAAQQLMQGSPSGGGLQRFADTMKTMGGGLQGLANNMPSSSPVTPLGTAPAMSQGRLPPAGAAVQSVPAAMRSPTPSAPTLKKGGSVKAKMSSVKSSASKRADGCATKGKTKGKMV